MGWVTPKYSKAEIVKAGRALVDSGTTTEDLEGCLEAINNWRSSHSFPLNTFQVTLRDKSYRIDKQCLVAQRLKRLSSIRLKLQRFPTMNLPQMQDIAGCRAVVSSVARVYKLRKVYLKSDLKHIFVREDDYIAAPKISGYRSFHLIYRYRSDRKQTYNGHQIEMQFRSRLQHAWATAVETVGTFLQQALKSSQGSDRWLRFFSLMGSALALRERTTLVPGTPTRKTILIRELRDIVRELQVKSKLDSYGAALRTMESPSVRGAKYYLLSLRPAEEQLTVSGYGAADLNRATTDYLETEKSIAGKPGAEAVLVSVESIESLRRAYPNYFLDTRVFIDAMKMAIS